MEQGRLGVVCRGRFGREESMIVPSSCEVFGDGNSSEGVLVMRSCCLKYGHVEIRTLLQCLASHEMLVTPVKI